ncbi:helix-turn-helix transcriptional regulator [Gallaecimonas mangrovi]|uniref:helix-turn-helix transcriptional regulator n=1 Tax=Gallaecimonas mangrovi TaxID=2291597 RepID=UPI000E208276|nr:YafY family protein [Gallaecimonas mangrovi]
MSRAQRLLDLMQLLRRHRYPVTGQQLAQTLNVSLRTLYRDIATLQGQGADISGEAGIGYQLKPGFTLPPMMFSEQEIEALVLGARWVSQKGDPALAQAANDMLAKVSAVLPASLRQELATTALLIGPGEPVPGDGEVFGQIRQAIRQQRKVSIHYTDNQGQQSQRTVWPFAMGFFDQCRVMLAWCELRQDYRHFRADRINGLATTDQHYSPSRHQLLALWRKSMGIEAPDY